MRLALACLALVALAAACSECFLIYPEGTCDR